ncbi:hypothetical protein GCM10027049_05040 [Mucilaginibacter puniceus]
MKKNYLLLLMPLLFAACQSKPTTEVATAGPTPDYPYKIKNPDNWVADTSHANTMLVLTALKSYENGDTALMKKCFADSITFNFDGYTFKGTNTEFVKMNSESKDTNIKLEVKDWEAVVSKAGEKQEWVTVWNTQHWTNAKGIADSAEFVDDVQVKDGKIVKVNEYTRHFKMK